MNASRKLAWHTSAVAAAALFSAGAAQSTDKQAWSAWSGCSARAGRDEHYRVWRDHGAAFFARAFELRAAR